MKWAATTAFSQPTQGPKDTAQHYRSQQGNTHGAVSAAHGHWTVQPQIPRSEKKELQLKAVDKYRAKPRVCSVLSGAAGHRAVPVIFISSKGPPSEALCKHKASSPQAAYSSKAPSPVPASLPHSPRPLSLVIPVSPPELGNSAPAAAQGQAL